MRLGKRDGSVTARLINQLISWPIHPARGHSPPSQRLALCAIQTRINGTGYPKGLVGENILLKSKNLTVAGVVEATASHRPYRSALGIDVALQEIEKNKGKLYDTTVVEACLRLLREKDSQIEGV